MAITTPGIWLPGPQAKPTAYGLFSVAQIGDTTDGHWQAGLYFEDALCQEVDSTLPGCTLVSGAPAKIPSPGDDFRLLDPFTLIGSYECPPVGQPADHAFRIAEARLRNREETGAEKVFWTGLTAAGSIDPSLANGDPNITPIDLTGGGAALDPVNGVALLEEALANCVPGLPVIHCPAKAAPALGSELLIYTDGTKATTINGTQVIIGGGYPATGPANVAVAADEAWLFGTGQVMVWRSEVFLNPPELFQAVDRTLNNTTVFAERSYAIGFSCCLFAVRIFLSCCLGGSS